jgi:hypothetical protein
MQCPQCSTEIDDEAAFCDECGIRVRETAVATLPVSAAPGAPAHSSPSATLRAKSTPRVFPVADTRSFDRASYNKKWNTPATAISHWNQFIRGLDISAMAFYGAVRTAIEQRNVPDTKLFLVEIPEGGIFSAKRDYLRVRRGDYVIDICAAPYADGFFVSSWLGPRKIGFLGALLLIPFLARMFRPITYYYMDTGSMFLTAVHSAVLEVLDQMTEAKGMRGLTELERKPIHRDFFGGR